MQRIVITVLIGAAIMLTSGTPLNGYNVNITIEDTLLLAGFGNNKVANDRYQFTTTSLLQGNLPMR